MPRPRSTAAARHDRPVTPRDSEREDWLASVLPGQPHRVKSASGDASFRRYFRVYTSGVSRILMDAPPPREDCRPFVRVTKLLSVAGVNVPEIFAANVERGFLLLSDMGDRLYLDALDDDSADALYGDALDTLVRLQSRGDASTVPHYDEPRLRDEMRLFVDWFLTRHLGLAVSPAATDVLQRAFSFLAGTCTEQPQVLVHRDYHSRNLMVVTDHNPGVLDYQDAVRGPATYDLVSLLRDVYLRWPQTRVDAWIEAWHRRAADAALLKGAGLDTATRWFDLTGVQRHLKVAGIFARLWYRDGKSRYLGDIPLTLEYLLAASSRHPELAGLATLLGDLDVVWRNEQATATLAGTLE
jgi:aminoglycoside/choline kinase family phosphotransferase